MYKRQVKCYPRLVFHLTVQGGEEMQYRIETKAAFRVVGILSLIHI